MSQAVTAAEQLKPCKLSYPRIIPPNPKSLPGSGFPMVFGVYCLPFLTKRERIQLRESFPFLMDDTLLPWIRMAVRLWDGFVPVTDKKMLNFVKRKRKQKKRNILEKWKRLSLRLLVAVRPPATCSVTVTSSDVVKPMSQYSTLTVVSSGGSGRCPSRGSKGAVSPVFLQWKSEADVHAARR